MTGLGMITVDTLDGNLLPSNVEYGISTNPYKLPVTAQANPIFRNLVNGVYYIFFRIKGNAWSINNMIINMVNCSSSIATVISATLKNIVYGIIDNQTIALLENIIGNSIMVFVEGKKLSLGVHYTYNSSSNQIVFLGGIDLANSLVEVEAEMFSLATKHYKLLSYTWDNNTLISLSETITDGTLMVFVEGRKLSLGVHYSYNLSTNKIAFFGTNSIMDSQVDLMGEV